MAKLKIYDINTDKMRNATQQDIDAMVRSISVMAYMVRVMRHALPDIVPQSGPGFPERLQAAMKKYLDEHGLMSN